MTKYLLNELAIVEDELAKLAPNGHIKASVIELPLGGTELRLHIEFVVRDTLPYRPDEKDVRHRTKTLLVLMQDYIARRAKLLDADAVDEEVAREARR